jgi:hypothetical protein
MIFPSVIATPKVIARWQNILFIVLRPTQLRCYNI